MKKFKLGGHPKVTYLVALRMNRWSDIQVAGTNIGVQSMSHAVGFLPVYVTLAALRKDYPDSEYAMIEPRKQQTKGTR